MNYFRWWVVQDDSAYGLALRVVAQAQRCLAPLGSNLNAASHPHSMCAMQGSFLELREVNYFRWWVVQDDSAYGLALRVVAQAQRCLAPLGSNLNAASHPHSMCAMQGSFLELREVNYFRWWVVQDSNLRPID